MKAILFDNDGTLVDTHDLILSSMRYSTRAVFGRVIPDDVLMRKVGQPLAVQACDFTDDEALQEEWLCVYREHNHAHHDEAVRAFPGVRDGLAELASRGVRLGVVTSKLHALAWRGLEICGLAPYLDCCIGADDCERFKPEPEPVLLGLDALGVPAGEAGECLYVGDSPFDLQAGRAAGCKTAAVTWGMFSTAILDAERSDFTCNTFDDLVALVPGPDGCGSTQTGGQASRRGSQEGRTA